MNSHPLLADGKYLITIGRMVHVVSLEWNVMGVPLPEEELVSASYAILNDCLETYDPKKASFQTYLWRQLQRLSDTARKEQRRILRESSLSSHGPTMVENYQVRVGEETIYMDRALGTVLLTGIQHVASLEERPYLDELSVDAQELVAFLVARGIQKGRYPTAANIGPRLGWTKKRMGSAWKEVKHFLHEGGRLYQKVEDQVVFA